MYQLSGQQIDYILNDISPRGIEMESLQQNLLDHVCCIIEQNLEEEGDFENFYQNTITTFYKDVLWEIEEETISLLTFKNYYTMKKIMMLSGIFSTFIMLTGIWFKYMHWPAAGLLLPLGILSGSLIFLPLLFTLKAKEQQTFKDKFVIAAGALAAILTSLSFVFKIMNWPFSITMLYASAAITLTLFLPLYLFSGIRNPATKTNTIVTALLVVMAYSLLFSLVRSPQSERAHRIVFTQDYLRNELILNTERSQLKGDFQNDSSFMASIKPAERINSLCEQAKSLIIESETMRQSIDEDFENKNVLLADHRANITAKLENILLEVKHSVLNYNSHINKGMIEIPTKASFLQKEQFECPRVLILLNEITQVQMFLLQNQRALIAEK
jgi:hypothetical protein